MDSIIGLRYEFLSNERDRERTPMSEIFEATPARRNKLRLLCHEAVYWRSENEVLKRDGETNPLT